MWASLKELSINWWYIAFLYSNNIEQNFDGEIHGKCFDTNKPRGSIVSSRQWRPEGSGPGSSHLTPSKNLQGTLNSKRDAKLKKGKRNSDQSGLHQGLAEVVPQRCSFESANMQIIHRKMSMRKCDFNKITMQLFFSVKCNYYILRCF